MEESTDVRRPQFVSLDGPSFGPLTDIHEGGRAVGCKISSVVLSDDGETDPDAPFALFVDLPPNFVVPRHAHPIPRMEVVLRGSIDVGEKVMRVGDVMVSRAHTFYGPFVVGPEGATTAEFCANVKDFAPYLEDGTSVSTAFQAANENRDGTRA